MSRGLVGQFPSGSGAPGPWAVGDPGTDPSITIPGDLGARVPDEADAHWAAVVEPLEPWLMMVQLDGSQTELHIRAYLGDPPVSLAHAHLDQVPNELRHLMGTAIGGVAGADVPDLWFDDACLHDAWQLTPDHRTAAASSSATVAAAPPMPVGGSGSEEFIETRRRAREREYFARHPGLKQAAIRLRGTSCEVCDFDFEAVYGVLGRGYVECHHLDPLADRFDAISSAPTSTTVDEVALLCANCHRMVHRQRPPLSPADLRGILGV